ncbi:MAG: hypothetical protein ACLVH8_03760 [Fusobacterium sp.]
MFMITILILMILAVFTLSYIIINYAIDYISGIKELATIISVSYCIAISMFLFLNALRFYCDNITLEKTEIKKYLIVENSEKLNTKQKEIITERYGDMNRIIFMDSEE